MKTTSSIYSQFPALLHKGFHVQLGDALDVLKTLPGESVHCIVTSPPYFGLRDYGVENQIGMEDTPDRFVDRLVSVFAEAHRILRPDGTLWINIGDSYAGKKAVGANVVDISSHNRPIRRRTQTSRLRVPSAYKPKDLMGIPWKLAFALRDDGWYLRSEIIWDKPNPMPESVTDRPTKAHEHLFLLTKSQKYYYDHAAIREPSATRPHAHGASKQKTQISLVRNAASDAAARQPDRIWAANGGRNKRSVWKCPVSSYKGAHFATFPEKLIEPCILAGCPSDGIVLDVFSGAATTGVVALKSNRRYLGIELNPEYCGLAEARLFDSTSPFKESRAA